MNDEKWVAWAIQTSRKWSDVKDVLKYTNIDFIDNDHRILIEHALELNKVIEKAQDNFTMELINETKYVLNQFYTYAVEHFNREEIFMEFYKLPNVDQHKYEHERILSILRHAIDDFESGKVKVSVKLKMQVMDWLIQHVNIVDYNFFDVDNWSSNLVNASKLDDIRPIIHLTGIDDIDHQHMKLTSMAIDLIHDMGKDLPEREINKSFDDFIEYAKYHFEYEHKFMTNYHIDDMVDHLKEHDYFIGKMTSYKIEAVDKELDVSSVKSWILTWWISHINQVDRRYFAFDSWAADVIKNAQSLDEVSNILRRTGIKEIDEDHLALMDVIIKLNKEITEFETSVTKMSGSSKKTLKDLNVFLKRKNDTEKNIIIRYLDEAYSVAKAHFEREERIMLKSGSPDLSSHKKEHEMVLLNFRSIKENYDNGLLDISTNIKTMILEWWIEHTNTTDFRTFVQRNDRLFRNMAKEDHLRKEEESVIDAGPND